jgi:hypothetical protein
MPTLSRRMSFFDEIDMQKYFLYESRIHAVVGAADSRQQCAARRQM